MEASFLMACASMNEGFKTQFELMGKKFGFLTKYQNLKKNERRATTQT